jgi:hypothetical protein
MWKKGESFSCEALGLQKEKPGTMTRASQSMKQKEVRLHAHFVAENRHTNGDGKDEVNDP